MLTSVATKNSPRDPLVDMALSCKFPVLPELLACESGVSSLIGGFELDLVMCLGNRPLVVWFI